MGTIKRMELSQEGRLLFLVKNFRFWLTIISSIICLFNASGADDYNLLLFFTSPHLMLLEGLSGYIREAVGNETILMLIWYILNIIGWFIIGWIIDIVIGKIRRK
jgi:hypothetical protein